MIKNQEKIIDAKTEKLSQIVKKYVDEIDALSETDDFTIDNIERMWGNLDEKAKEVYKELSREIIEELDERKIIRLKKASTKREE